ncbi:MAG: hypothetical protein JW938_06690 [Candidatus Omnitrophica bacterium]|nr:hypothetical protein [Candidatus Omnitrophota bacterium]
MSISKSDRVLSIAVSLFLLTTHTVTAETSLKLIRNESTLGSRITEENLALQDQLLLAPSRIDPEYQETNIVASQQYRDLIINYLETQYKNKVFSTIKPVELERLFFKVHDIMSKEGRSSDEMRALYGKEVQEFLNDIIENSMRFNHMYMGHMLTTPLAMGIFVNAIIDYMNINMVDDSATEISKAIEKQTVQWLARVVGYKGNRKNGKEIVLPSGIITTDGTEANKLAIITMRDHAIDRALAKKKINVTVKDIGVEKALRLLNNPELVLFTSIEAHYSWEKMAGYVGLSAEETIKLQSDRDLKLNVKILEDEIEDKIKHNEIVIGIVGTMGTTETGNIDDITVLRKKADKYGLWLHIDAAWGGPFHLVKGYGLEKKTKDLPKADSITIDPHKMLYIPYNMGAFILKDMKNAQYITSDIEEGIIRKPFTQSSRRFDALKLWASMRWMGIENYQALLSHVLQMTQYAKKIVDEKRTFENMTPVELNIMNFRYVPIKLRDEMEAAMSLGDRKKVREINRKLSELQVKIFKALHYELGFAWISKAGLATSPFYRNYYQGDYYLEEMENGLELKQEKSSLEKKLAEERSSLSEKKIIDMEHRIEEIEKIMEKEKTTKAANDEITILRFVLQNPYISSKSIKSFFELMEALGDAVAQDKPIAELYKAWEGSMPATVPTKPFHHFFLHKGINNDMRDIFTKIMEMIIKGVDDRKITWSDRDALLKQLTNYELPKGVMEIEMLLDDLAIIIADANIAYKGQRTVARIAIFGNLVGSALNQNLIGWEVSPAATTIERQLIQEMIREFVYFPEDARSNIMRPSVKDAPGGVVNDNTFNDLVTAFLVAKNKFFAEYPLYYDILSKLGYADYFKEPQFNNAEEYKMKIRDAVTKMKQSDLDDLNKVDVTEKGNIKALTLIREAIVGDPRCNIIVISSKNMMPMVTSLMHFAGFDRSNVRQKKAEESLSEIIKEEQSKNNIVLMVCLSSNELGECDVNEAREYTKRNLLYAPWFHVMDENKSCKYGDPIRSINRKMFGRLFDSVSMDLNKVFRMPYGSSIVLFRNEEYLQKYLKQSAPYLDFNKKDDIEYGPSIGTYSVLGSRGFNSLPLLLTLYLYGQSYLDQGAGISESLLPDTNTGQLSAA